MSRYRLPKASEHFSYEDPSDLVDKHMAYTAAMDKSLSQPRSALGSPGAELATRIDEHRELLLTKSLSPAQIDSVRNALADSDIRKDISTTSPLSSGLVAYDLAAPAKLLTPHATPLRNRVSREVGQGLNHQFKVISGFSGTRTGGSAGAPIRHGVDESTTNTFGPGNIAYARGPKIQYASYEKTVPYIQTGLSDEVSFAAQFGGATFQDIRQLSSQSLIFATMLSDENMILGGRGTKSGFAGALAAPTGVTLTKRPAVSNEVGAGGAIANVYVYVTSVSQFGESVPSTVATVATVASGNVIDVAFTDAPGALGYRVYLGTVTGPTTAYAAGISNSSTTLNVAPVGFDFSGNSTVPGSPITIHFNGTGTSGVPANTQNATPSADSTAAVNEYDGILTHLSGSESGYVKRLNNTLAGGDAGNVGNTFENAFASLWDSVKSDPDELFFSGRDRKQLSDQLKTQNSSSYRITVDSGSAVSNAKLGSLVTGLVNEVTGKMVDVTVLPWLLSGNVPIVSWSLPQPGTNVSNTWAVRGPMDMTMYQWPIQQYLYEASSYQFNSLISYASRWSGLIQGIFTA